MAGTPDNRRLQPFRYLHDCSGCFRLERLPGGACTHWKAPPFHGAPTTDVPAVCQQGVKGSLRTMQYSKLLPFIWYNGGGEPIRPRLPRTLPSQRAVQATAIFPRGVSDG